LRVNGDILSRPAELERVCEGRGKEVTQAQAKLQSLTHDVAQANQRLQDAEGQEKVRFKHFSISHGSRVAHIENTDRQVEIYPLITLWQGLSIQLIVLQVLTEKMQSAVAAAESAKVT
jgi:TolA-binding protein